MAKASVHGQKRILLVNRDFQLRYTKLALVVGAASTGLTALIILYPLYEFRILRIPRFLPLPILSAMAAATFSNMAFIGSMALVLTHKIAGPMYSLARAMRWLGLGRLGTKLSQRPADDLKFMVRQFNHMAAGLRAQAEADLEALELALSLLGEAPQRAPHLVALKEHLTKQCRRLEKRLHDS